MLIRGLAPSSLGKLVFHRPPPIDPDQPLRIFYAVCDHYEPKWQRPAKSIEQQRVARWRDDLPRVAEGITDSIGNRPKHTFFYPEEEYEREYLDVLQQLCEAGLGDVEIHLHHDNDTAENLTANLLRFAETLHNNHGFLQRRTDGLLSYGFIHGNWCLDNSRPDGRWCGVNNEIDVLRQTGCYADFTLPAAPSPAQTKIINSIYYAIDDPDRPKSHDTGVAAAVGQTPPDDSLLMIQGPLAIDYDDRIRGVIPRIDYNNYQGIRGPSMRRMRRWIDAAVHVAGNPNWRFVKVHTHGCEEGNMDILLGQPMRQLHQDLAAAATDDPNFKYYYVTARQMADLVHQAEAGQTEPTIS